MKKSVLVLIALSLLLPITAEAGKGRRTFNIPTPGLASPELTVSVPVKLPEGVSPQKEIWLRVLIKDNGRVISYGPVKRGLAPALIQAAEKAIQEWRYKPAMMTWPDGTFSFVQTRGKIKVPVIP
ncbi:MAG: hypothetical protein QG633_354 [Patescibacteria group bacterium]|jgi:hypothetical protein|nr:hypothetical protein [Patescibacteria group bacterium]